MFELFGDWKIWILIFALVIGTLAYLFFPQTKQDPAVIQEITREEAIVIFVYETDWLRVEEYIKQHYPQYVIAEKHYDKTRNGYWLKLIKK